MRRYPETIVPAMVSGGNTLAFRRLEKPQPAEYSPAEHTDNLTGKLPVPLPCASRSSSGIKSRKASCSLRKQQSETEEYMSNSRNLRLVSGEFTGLTIASPVEAPRVDGGRDGDPQLPAGYRHIRSAIMALLGKDSGEENGAVCTQA
jgi:hypothetical protein